MLISLQPNDMVNRLAFSISAAGHLFCFLAFNVVIMPQEINHNKYGPVSFIGPLLLENLYIQKTHSDKWVGVRVSQTSSSGVSFAYPVSGDPLKPAALIAQTVTDPNKTAMGYGLWAMGKTSSAPSPQPPAFSDFYLDGDITKGQILFLPKPPALSIIDERLKPANIALEFSVSPEGKVESIKKLISSGDASIDAIWTRYLLKWRFIPLEAKGGRVAIIRFKAAK